MRSRGMEADARGCRRYLECGQSSLRSIPSPRIGVVPALVLLKQAHSPLTRFRRIFVRCLAHDGSTFSGVGASGKPGAVHKIHGSCVKARHKTGVQCAEMSATAAKVSLPVPSSTSAEAATDAKSLQTQAPSPSWRHSGCIVASIVALSISRHLAPPAMPLAKAMSCKHREHGNFFIKRRMISFLCLDVIMVLLPLCAPFCLREKNFKSVQNLSQILIEPTVLLRPQQDGFPNVPARRASSFNENFTFILHGSDKRRFRNARDQRAARP